MNAFNEFGKPIGCIEELATTLECLARNFLDGMVQEGYSATDIRAAGSYLSGSVDLATSTAILHLQRNIHEQKRQNIDPNLDEIEQNYARNAHTKIQAIIHYRHRTGLGLRESKDAVEAWIKRTI